MKSYIDIKLKKYEKFLLLIVSFFLVAFGQPAWIWWFGVIAAACGYALFWRVSISEPSNRSRFLMATTWFTAVQLVQLSWFISHPYYYIYPVYFLLSLAVGLQFGALSLLVTIENIGKIPKIIAIASLWTILEWLRLYFLSGFSWNPIGMALTTTLYSLQMASLWGLYGLSFWVAIVNLLALRAWLTQKAVTRRVFAWVVAASLPFVYGIAQYEMHDSYMAQENNSSDTTFAAVLVQTAFPAEEALGIEGKNAFIAYVLGEWDQILKITKQHQGKPIDLIAFPEFVVPFGTYTCIYPYEYVNKSFEEIYGPESIKSFPPLEAPFAREFDTENGKVFFVNNAFWSQAIANYFNAPIIIGLEDVEEIKPGKREYYSAALFFKPEGQTTEEEKAESAFSNFWSKRYEKRVLVPLGEYIPFEFLKELASKYGVEGSFTFGKGAKVLNCGKANISPSICYEETFGDMMRESRLLGANMLVNLTSDVWYPDSRLPQQHFDHARLRTVETGTPLLRACNTGITCAIDSLGRVVGALEEYTHDNEWLSDSLYVQVSTYHYQTLYSKTGDGLIIAFCLFSLILFRKKKRS